MAARDEESSQSKKRFQGSLAKQLLEDVRQLAVFAAQIGKLPSEVKTENIYIACRDFDENKDLASEQFSELVRYYQILERTFPEITARSLAATEPTEPGNIRTSPAGKYLFKLWAATGVIVVAVLTVNLFRYITEVNQVPPGDEVRGFDQFIELVYQALIYLEPFLYGALGAFAYILRVTEERLHTREFDPGRAPEHINRLVLGTLAGGSIILFVAQIPNGDEAVVQISAAALGFLAGYSVEFLFQTLDRVVQAILPKVGIETIARRARQRRNQELIQRYQSQLEQAEDEETKKLYRDIISELQALQ